MVGVASGDLYVWTYLSNSSFLLGNHLECLLECVHYSMTNPCSPCLPSTLSSWKSWNTVWQKIEEKLSFCFSNETGRKCPITELNKTKKEILHSHSPVFETSLWTVSCLFRSCLCAMALDALTLASVLVKFSQGRQLIYLNICFVFLFFDNSRHCIIPVACATSSQLFIRFQCRAE